MPEFGIRWCLTYIAQNKGEPNTPQSLLPGVLPRSRLKHRPFYSRKAVVIFAKKCYLIICCVWSLEISPGICRGISSPTWKGSAFGWGYSLPPLLPCSAQPWLLSGSSTCSPTPTPVLLLIGSRGTAGPGPAPEAFSPLSAPGWSVYCPLYSSVNVTTV